MCWLIVGFSVMCVLLVGMLWLGGGAAFGIGGERGRGFVGGGEFGTGCVCVCSGCWFVVSVLVYVLYYGCGDGSGWGGVVGSCGGLL